MNGLCCGSRVMLPRRLAKAAERPAWRSLRADAFVQLQQPPLERCASLHSSTEVHQEPAVSAEECPGGGGARPLTVLNRYRALVLDSSYQPIDVVNWQRAICLEIATKVDVLEYYEDVTVKAPRDEFLLPAVVRVRYFQRRGVKRVRVALNRHNIFLRDNFQCQYCGAEGNLTLDHVIPSSLGGGHSWENLVTCCSRCNSHKGNKTLSQLKWKLKNKPREPSPHEVTMMVAQWTGNARGSLPPQWDSYLQPSWTAKQKHHPSPL